MLGNAGALVLETDLHLARVAPSSRHGQRTLSVHRVERVAREPEEDLAQLPLVGHHVGQLGVQPPGEPALGVARLVADQLQHLVDQHVQIGGRPPAARIPHEVEQAPGDLLAPVGLLLDQRQIGGKVLERVQVAQVRVLGPLLERLRAARDGGQRIVQLVRHPRGEPARGGEPLGQEHLPLQPLLQRDVLHQHQDVGRLRSPQRRGGQAHREGLAARGQILLGVPHLARRDRALQKGPHHPCLGRRHQLHERPPRGRSDRHQGRPLPVRADHAQLRVEHEEAQGQCLQHDLHEALLLVEFVGARLHHGLEPLGVGAHRAEEPGVLECHRGLVREGRHQRLLLGGEVVHVGAQDGEGPDGLVADDERGGQHGAEARLRVAHARVAVEIGGLGGAPLLHRGSGDALAHPQADRGKVLGGQVEAGGGD